MIEVYFDGACRNNGRPGARAGCGWVIFSDGERKDGHTIIKPEGKTPLTNNVAEYAGLYHALEVLNDAGLSGAAIIARGDSKLVVEQMSGRWHVKGGAYLSMYRRTRELARKFKKLKLEWIPREKNLEADALATGELCGESCWCKDHGSIK